MLTLALGLLMAGQLARWLPAGAGVLLAEAAATAALFAGALLVGAALLGRIAVTDDLTPAERAVHALALGLGALVLTVLGLGLAGVLGRGRVLAAAGLVGLAGLVASRRALASLARCLTDLFGDARSPGGAAAAVALCGALLLPLAAALLPQVFYDTLLYHLEAPERWLRAGKLVADPYSFHLNYPVNVSALYLLVRALAPEAGGGLVHWGFLAASALALLALGRRVGKGVGILAALLFCVTPTAIEIGGLAVADHAVVFWTLAAASAWLAWSGRRAPGLLLLCGLEIGLAIGAKYTAILVALVPLGLLTLAAPGRRPAGARLRDAALLGIAAVVAFSPWLVRNGLETGNPLYPYLLPARAEFATPHSLQVEIENRMVEGSGAARIARHLLAGPVEILTTGVGAAPVVGLSLFLPLPLLLLQRPLPAVTARLLALAGIGFLAWDLTVHVTRYALPWLALLAVPAASALLQERRVARRRILIALVAAGLLQNLYLGWLATDWSALRDILRGARTREAYLEEYVSYYPAARHANEHLSPTDKILFVGEARGYYCRIPHATSGPERPPRLFDIAAAAPDRPLAEVLLERGFTHVLVSRSEIRRLSAQGRLRPPSPAVRSAVDALLGRDVEILADDGNVLLGRLRAPRPGLSPPAPPPR